MRFNLFLFINVLIVSLLCIFCKVNNPPDIIPKKRITDGLVDKAWKASRVQEGSVTVFQAGQSSIYPGYQNYQLVFTGSKAKLTEYTNEVFAGDWTVSETGSRTYLTLQNLNPAPTNSGGKLEFEVTSFSDTGLVLAATKANLKTGNSLNVYTLVPK